MQVQNPRMSQCGELFWCCYLPYGHRDRCNYRKWEETRGCSEQVVGPSRRPNHQQEREGGAHAHFHRRAEEHIAEQDVNGDMVRELQRRNAQQQAMIEQLRRTNDSLVSELQIARGQKK